MAPVCRWLVGAWLAALLVLLARPAHADGTAHTVPVAVLTLDSDDAEENADSLTLALRSRIRASQGWSLTETSQSVGMLTAALQCPSKPIPADCEQRIADQIKTDRYIYGFVTRGSQANQVTAEIHLYQKSKPDTVIRESYAENLKDQNDDTLRKIAQRVLDRLGNNAVGTIVVKMGAESGEVIVDGDKRIPLQSGSARLELAPGSHSVEVLVGGRTQKRNVLVNVGKETVVDLSLAASDGVVEDPGQPGRPFPTRKVVGGGMMALGAAGVVVGVLEFVAYKNRQDDGKAAQKDPNHAVQKVPPGKEASDVCGTADLPDNSVICKANSAAKQDSALGWVFTGVGAALLGAGAYVFFTQSSGSSDKPASPRNPKIVPNVGPTYGGLTLSGAF